MENKCVVLGVTGGIAAYKSAYLVRLLKKEGYDVIVIMSQNSTRFISPLTFETLSGNPVVMDTYDKAVKPYGNMEHISLSEQADLFVCAPATANFIGKTASGIADDILSTSVLAMDPDTPKLIFPAMNVNMYKNPVTRKNIEYLNEIGYQVFEPGSGFLACGVEATGRMPEPELIKMFCDKFLTVDDLNSRRIIVTAGATIEDIDPVRYITNRSTGRMGAAVAVEAWKRGADVTCICNKEVKLPEVITRVDVRSAEDMLKAVEKHTGEDENTVLVMAAAVADFRPEKVCSDKIKKGGDNLVLNMKKTVDISMMVKENYSARVIGFAAESGELRKNALTKLKNKGFEMIVANDITGDKTGFASHDNRCLLMDGHGSMDTGVRSKNEIAVLICDYISGKLKLKG